MQPNPSFSATSASSNDVANRRLVFTGPTRSIHGNFRQSLGSLWPCPPLLPSPRTLCRTSCRRGRSSPARSARRESPTSPRPSLLPDSRTGSGRSPPYDVCTFLRRPAFFCHPRLLVSPRDLRAWYHIFSRGSTPPPDFSFFFTVSLASRYLHFPLVQFSAPFLVHPQVPHVPSAVQFATSRSARKGVPLRQPPM